MNPPRNNPDLCRETNCAMWFNMRVVLATLLYLGVAPTNGLECYSCQNVADPSACTSTRTCAADQSCYKQSRAEPSGRVYDMGCRGVQVCGVHLPGLIVGRSLEKRQQAVCHQCCSVSLCNAQLCMDIGSNATSKILACCFQLS
ncbi:uncharacterized protein LOC127863885 [Dreissena polymorpha]|uniref:uncharacterized protein LOC127863885 n=1 Tax=Dreissena polymorpha TaxID=45954 RepID=UPI002264F691|nr:uncharacterized protein LOC127863885 [Dreissena polymorpha]